MIFQSVLNGHEVNVASEMFEPKVLIFQLDLSGCEAHVAADASKQFSNLIYMNVKQTLCLKRLGKKPCFRNDFRIRFQWK